MAKIKAEHATAGKYHLETNYDRENGRWEWWAKGIKPNDVPEFTGVATNLTAAKKDPCSRIGLVVAPTWTKIGPEIDVPD
jgi:hypothetical protein